MGIREFFRDVRDRLSDDDDRRPYARGDWPQRNRPRTWRADYDEAEPRAYWSEREGRPTGRWQNESQWQQYPESGRFQHGGRDERHGLELFRTDYDGPARGRGAGHRHQSRWSDYGDRGRRDWQRIEETQRGGGLGGFLNLDRPDAGGFAGSGATYRGRGPRGWKRSDDRIREDVCELLTDDPYVDASEVEVTVRDGEVTLSGLVESRRDKRYAEEIVERIAGVQDVHNRLRVRGASDAVLGTSEGGAPISTTRQ